MHRDRRPGTGPVAWWQPVLIGLLFMGGQALTMIALSRGDVALALSTSGFVRKTVSSGVWRAGGGPFERTVCTLTVFGATGLTSADFVL